MSTREDARLVTLLELEALRLALSEWRQLLLRRHGWGAVDEAYVRHGCVLSAALYGSEGSSL